MSSELPPKIQELIRQYGVDYVRFLYVDLSGQIRGKITSIQSFESRVKTGIGLVKGMLAQNMLDKMQTDTGLGATGEVRMVPDLESFTYLPYAAPAASLVCDLIQLDCKPWQFCPRDLLKQQILRLEEHGLSIQAAYEPEYMIGRFDLEGDLFNPIDTDVCFGTEAMDLANEFYRDLLECLYIQGIKVEQIYPELGHGQHEISIKYAPALEACDKYIILKEAIRGVANSKNLFFTAAPKPFENQPGNGCHLHFSIWDKENKKNMTGSGDGDGLSTIARNFIAGLVSHLPALVSFTCPSVNSYRRLKPKSWSSAYTCWGLDNREAAVRVPSVYWGREEESANIELKCVDNTINPHLAMAAVIACGLDGVEQKLEPPPPVQGDPHELTPDEMKAGQVTRLPESLNNALIELETDLYLKKALGETFTNTYITVKTSEVSAFALDSDFELAQHRIRY